ncbi:hypothetical protein [Sphingomonas sp.]|uniref:hypothetical protein n=1 Tax=Sphingomonas sp. TaxID=28214 RepID=UPI00325FCFA3
MLKKLPAFFAAMYMAVPFAAVAANRATVAELDGIKSIGAATSINNINAGMPNRISMNVTVPKQTQGATFGEKVNAGKITVVLVKDGCVILFPSNTGYKINIFDKSIKELSPNRISMNVTVPKQTQGATFGEKVNQGLHSAGGALAQGASLLGGALPGGAIISAAVSSVGNLAGGAGGGAAAASYARTGTQVWKMGDNESDSILELSEGDFELVIVIAKKMPSGLKDTLKTQVRIGFTIENGVLKTKHDTAKNSVNNIR